MSSPWADEPFVYFAIEDGPAGAIKIGVAVDPRDRIRQMATGTPRKLVMLGAFRGGFRQERMMQLDVLAHRIKGEWFRAHVDVIRAALQRREVVEAPFAAEVLGIDPRRIESCRRRKWLVRIPECGPEESFHLSDVEIFARRLDQDGGDRVERLRSRFPTLEQRRLIRRNEARQATRAANRDGSAQW